MGLTQFNIIELSTASATILGAIAMLLAQTQKSKCKKCKLCCGCVECDRELNADIENQLDTTAGDDDDDESKEPDIPKVEIPKVEIPKPEIPKVKFPK